MIVALLLGVVGMFCLAASMARHHRALLPWQPALGRSSLQAGGWVAIAASCGVAVVTLGAALGTLTWLGLLSVAAAVVLLLANRNG